jgi:hypothetical protein
MRVVDVLSRLSGAGIRLSVERDRLRAEPRSALTDEARALIHAHKAELLALLASRAIPEAQAEARRLRVLAVLAEQPSLRYALLTDNKADPDAVILAFAIRGIGTCELNIPRQKYDPLLLLTLIERNGGTVH